MQPTKSIVLNVNEINTHYSFKLCFLFSLISGFIFTGCGSGNKKPVQIARITLQVDCQDYINNYHIKDSGLYTSDLKAFQEKIVSMAMDSSIRVLKKRIASIENLEDVNLYKELNTSQIHMVFKGRFNQAELPKLLTMNGKFKIHESYSLAELAPYLKNADSTYNATLKKRDSLKGDIPKYERYQHILEKLLFPNGGSSATANLPITGMVRPEDTAKVNRIFEMKEIKDLLPSDLKLSWGTLKVEGKLRWISLASLRINFDSHPIDNNDIAEAYSNKEEDRKEYEVVLRMNEFGKARWKTITTENTGKFLAMSMDDLVYSFPKVNGTITGGMASINGFSSEDEASTIADVLKGGALPFKLSIVKQEITPVK